MAPQFQLPKAWSRIMGRATPRLAAAICAVLVLLAAAASAGEPAQRVFASPKRAVEALLVAARGGQAADLLRILGPGNEDIVSSGDPVADRQARARFLAAYGEMNKVAFNGPDRAQLMLGADGWPFPIPLAKVGNGWRFDTIAGRQEILDRRIGRNELNAIEFCRTYVEAQGEYADADRQGGGLAEYARKFQSTPGLRDGLYWPMGPDGESSPLGPLVASARAEGYDADSPGGTDRQPYHGYLYKILLSQGSAAPGGARDYVVNGRMIGGFALVAFPARYGDSGIMTFIVNHDGSVFQKDLGTDTAAIAHGMTEFNPDQDWKKL